MPAPDSRVLLLSPHPDDIAWSLGGTLARMRGNSAELHVLTFFTQTRYAPSHPANGDPREVSRVREEEERAWARENGVLLRRATLEDASLRGYDDDTEMGAEPAEDVVRQVAEHVRTTVSDVDPGLVLVPLAAGGHVDHAAVRLAAAELVPPARLAWYEDLPYATTDRPELPPGCREVLVGVDAHRSAKEAGVMTFSSQEPAEVLPVLLAHMNAVGGERVWFSDPSTADRLRLLKG
ncbi:hypothetical protein Misp01_09800 [Microtetraspora sp. NBRC 13810]|uniref:PIG-L deacetylase family protein n=1 Tax=Microtetraspora sp. NBRC 13810 TaxID=3030990 RepID=UPI0024A4873D|nr:PIG-L family deacetylase [Microtetraspora sp. NBRC 13810]GLW05850.1 hypothetical protein Misp01_09800 [Microtetraspora sp. NBRC 13810]